MGICRDTFGKLSYTLTVPVTEKHSKVYSVTRGENEIIEHRPYIRSNACIILGHNFWQEIGPFDSFVKAVRYLKENKDRLL